VKRIGSHFSTDPFDNPEVPPVQSVRDSQQRRQHRDDSLPPRGKLGKTFVAGLWQGFAMVTGDERDQVTLNRGNVLPGMFPDKPRRFLVMLSSVRRHRPADVMETRASFQKQPFRCAEAQCPRKAVEKLERQFRDVGGVRRLRIDPAHECANFPARGFKVRFHLLNSGCPRSPADPDP
jgi:hypothetical protein